jgi:hypothetical protein
MTFLEMISIIISKSASLILQIQSNKETLIVRDTDVATKHTKENVTKSCRHKLIKPRKNTGMDVCTLF